MNRIHVVFKTHLDIGYTGYAGDVLAEYRDSFIPSAIEVARQLRLSGSPARLTWSTGTWLIQHTLETGTDDQRVALEHAIADGDVTWHALPFTTHSELLSADSFAAGIALSHTLDARFGRQTIAAKMTDVPGHSAGIVPLLAAGGVEYLHIGVNPASAVPDVPRHFVWVGPDGSEVVVTYDADYGSKRDDESAPSELADRGDYSFLDEDLCLFFTNDNMGPPTREQVTGLFASLAAQHPDAEIVASTLDDFGRYMMSVRDQLPRVTAEIGDSWIFGASADPIHLAHLSRLQRYRDTRMPEGEEGRDVLARQLLLGAEHTFGESAATFMPDFVHHDKPDFAAARDRDVIDVEENPARYAYAEKLYRNAGAQGHRYSAIAQSWSDKRAYTAAALAGLPAAHRGAAAAYLHEAWPEATSDGAIDVEAGSDLALGRFDVRFADDGSISTLTDAGGREWATSEHRIGRYRYQVYDADDLSRWLSEYARDLDVTGYWATLDFGKPGLEALPQSGLAGTYAPTVTSMRRCRIEGADRVEVVLVLPAGAHERFGAPSRITLVYDFALESPEIRLRIVLEGKDASRIPEASWLSVVPQVADPSAWRLRKLGSLVDPMNVVSRGSRRWHAIEAAEYDGPDGRVRIEPLDAPVVAVGAPVLLRFDDELPVLEGGLHFLLHNNVWGTNFRQWFDEDFAAEFTLRLGA